LLTNKREYESFSSSKKAHKLPTVPITGVMVHDFQTKKVIAPIAIFLLTFRTGKAMYQKL